MTPLGAISKYFPQSESVNWFLSRGLLSLFNKDASQQDDRKKDKNKTRFDEEESYGIVKVPVR